MQSNVSLIAPKSNNNPLADDRPHTPPAEVIKLFGNLQATGGYIGGALIEASTNVVEHPAAARMRDGAELDAELDKLIALNDVAYNAIRTETAKRLGMRLKQLDDAVRAHRRKRKDEGKQERRTPPIAANRRPTILIEGGSLSLNATTAEKLLVKYRYPIYQRGTDLLRPVITDVSAGIDPTTGAPRKTKTAALVQVTDTHLRDVLCTIFEWLRFDKREMEWVPTNPPKDVAGFILNRAGTWTFPTINGIVSTPTLRRDGTILTKEGYDADTGLILFNPPPMPEIPENPTEADARAALALLEDLIEEFPYVDRESKAVGLSAILTPAARGAVTAVPMHAFSAPLPGSGKTYSVDLPSTIFSGMPCPVIGQGVTFGEFEKRLNTSLIEGHPLISIDNVNGKLGGDALCHAIERPIIDIRLLGASKSHRVINTACIYATGNNIQLVDDVVRRTLLCRLDPKVERPELIRRKKDPIALVKADRGKYIAACLTILRAFIVAGRPVRRDTMQIGSFQEWSDLVRGALIWLGHADPVKTMEKAREEDPVLIALRDMFKAMADTFGTGPQNAKSARQIIDAASAHSINGRIQVEDNALMSALAHVQEAQGNAYARRAAITTVQLGKWLGRHKDRQIAGLKLVKIENEKEGARWYIHKG